MAPSQPRSKPNFAAEKNKAKALKRRDQLSFSKRRNGLFIKVTELSILCQSETALIVTSKSDGGDEIFACGYPSPDAVKEVQRELLAVVEELQRRGSVFPSWWETPIDDMDVDSVEQFKGSIEKLRLNLIARLRYCQMMVAPPPPPPPVQNAKFGVWVSCAHSSVSNKFTPGIESNLGLLS